MAITYIDNFPIRFGVTSNPCDFCEADDSFKQLVQYSDKVEFGWLASLCGSDVVTCGNFEDEVCIGASWDAFGTNWDYTTNGGSGNDYLYHVFGAGVLPLKQVGIITPGLWKVTFDIVYTDRSNIGTVTVTAGDSTGVAITSIGSHTLYLTNTLTAGDLAFTPTTDFSAGIDNVTATKVTDQYKVAVYDMNGVRVTPFYSQTGNYSNFFYLKTTWGTFTDTLGLGQLPEGCYKICVVDGCTNSQLYELLTNPNFTGSATGWTLGANWAYSANAVCHTPGATATLSQAFSPVVGRKYTVTVSSINRTAGAYVIDVGGNTSATYSVDGSYQYTFTATTTGSLTLTPEAAFDGCIDSLSIFVHEDSYVTDACSMPFDLKTTQVCTHLLTWNNDSDAFQYPYSKVSGGFTSSLRHKMVRHIPKYPDDRTTTKEADGVKKMLYSDRDKSWNLSIEMLPEYLHDAIAIAISHDHFYYDGVEHILRAGEESPEWTRGFNLANVELEVQLATYNARNRY